VLTLYTTPIVYLYMDRLGRFLSHLRADKGPVPEAAE
jgi:hypothetical protein